MRRQPYKTLYAAVILILVAFSSFAADNPKDRIDYWQKNFEELKPENDPRAAIAHEIFKKVLDAAGKRPGVVPRLFIVNSDSAYIPLAFAIPDGGIIISKKVLNICYSDPKNGNDRLAFILAHEIAHQLKDDFWHMRFFQAVELSRTKDPGHAAYLDEVKSIAASTEKVLAKELQADEYGIVYASMAGFDTNAVVTDDGNTDFFEYFYKSLDPENISGMKKDPTHPTPKQRAEAVKARLRQVAEKIELFRLGVFFYQAEEYQMAVSAFSEFLRFYPSREVYHNLAASYHQLALKQYAAWKGEEPLPFKLSISIDPETQAEKITLKNLRGGGNTSEDLFKKYIDSAIENYQKAISLDPAYILSYNNLGCALILKDKDEIYKAIGMFKEALKIDPKYKEALNNLGVAFFIAENPAKAKEHLLMSYNLDNRYAAPLFNLGKIAYIEKNEAEAKKQWTAYLKLDPSDSRADAVRKIHSIAVAEKNATVPEQEAKESILGLEAGAYKKETPSDFGELIRSVESPLGEEPVRIQFYKNGVITVLQDKTVILISTTADFKGKSSKGISIGAASKDILAKYGKPAKIQSTARGENWFYKEQGISFYIEDGRVRSWLLF